MNKQSRFQLNQRDKVSQPGTSNKVSDIRIAHLILCVMLVVTSIAPIHVTSHLSTYHKHSDSDTPILVIPGYDIGVSLSDDMHDHSEHASFLELCDFCFLANALSASITNHQIRGVRLVASTYPGQYASPALDRNARSFYASRAPPFFS